MLAVTIRDPKNAVDVKASATTAMAMRRIAKERVIGTMAPGNDCKRNSSAVGMVDTAIIPWRRSTTCRSAPFGAFQCVTSHDLFK